MPTTANFGWTTPVDGGSPGVWGALLNTVFDDIDSDLNTVKTTADAAMPKAGGAFTGNVDHVTGTMTVSDLGSGNGAQTVDLDDANYFKIQHTSGASITFTFSNYPASGKAEFWMVEVDRNGVVQGMIWPSEVEWHDDTTPTAQVNGFQIFLFWTVDGGTTVYGKLVYENTSL